VVGSSEYLQEELTGAGKDDFMASNVIVSYEVNGIVLVVGVVDGVDEDYVVEGFIIVEVRET
jgi:hypothetical protein